MSSPIETPIMDVLDRIEPMDVTTSSNNGQIKYLYPLYMAHSFLSTCRLVSSIKCQQHNAKARGALLMRDTETNGLVALAVCRKCSRDGQMLNQNDRMIKPINDQILHNVWETLVNLLLHSHNGLIGVTGMLYNWDVLREKIKTDETRIDREEHASNEEAGMMYGDDRSLDKVFFYYGIVKFILGEYACYKHNERIIFGIAIRDKLFDRRFIIPFCHGCLGRFEPTHSKLPEDLLFAVRLAHFRDDDKPIREWFQDKSKFWKDYYGNRME
ncbi:unnamed protein product [Caenorhabditis bovis]|uniref:Uncharacterized protein n=1 Tax=Caenorhabditis bovis TaxID=2654633 RepID=A0A8S1F2R1_9PELO|nr:unnamed protein product [Caenorhabditis bovis]